MKIKTIKSIIQFIAVTGFSLICVVYMLFRITEPDMTDIRFMMTHPGLFAYLFIHSVASILMLRYSLLKENHE